MLIVGVTGSLATGKTTVARLLKMRGAVVIDADAMAHRALARGTPISRRVVRIFGPSVLGGRGAISRRKLAEKVFGNSRRLRQLCRLIHPYVGERIRKELAHLSKDRPSPVVVIDAPLLIEAGFHRWVDMLVVVKAPRRVQVERAARRLGLSPEAAGARLKAQWPLAKKIQKADVVIDNGGSMEATRDQVRTLWSSLVHRIHER